MFNTQFNSCLSRGDGTGDRPNQILVKGDGNKNHPYYIQNARFALRDLATVRNNRRSLDNLCLI
jgi:hypothetical protein